MGNIHSRGRDISCDFCGTGTQNLKRLVRDPSKGKGSSAGTKTSKKICQSCLEDAKQKDPQGWQRRIDSGRYKIKQV